jgi:hypothetical protein
MAQNRTTRLYQEARAQLFRPRFLIALGLASLITGWLLWQARDVNQYGPNVALNIGSDLAVLIATIFVIGSTRRSPRSRSTAGTTRTGSPPSGAVITTTTGNPAG